MKRIALALIALVITAPAAAQPAPDMLKAVPVAAPK
jgi:hypothetical protein